MYSVLKQCITYTEKRKEEELSQMLSALCDTDTDTDIAPTDSVSRERGQFNIKNTLPVCYPYLALNIKIPGNGIDCTKVVAHHKAKKADLAEKVISTGRKMCRGITEGARRYAGCEKKEQILQIARVFRFVDSRIELLAVG